MWVTVWLGAACEPSAHLAHSPAWCTLTSPRKLGSSVGWEPPKDTVGGLSGLCYPHCLAGRGLCSHCWAWCQHLSLKNSRADCNDALQRKQGRERDVGWDYSSQHFRSRPVLVAEVQIPPWECFQETSGHETIVPDVLVKGKPPRTNNNKGKLILQVMERERERESERALQDCS